MAGFVVRTFTGARALPLAPNAGVVFLGAFFWVSRAPAAVRLSIAGVDQALPLVAVPPLGPQAFRPCAYNGEPLRDAAGEYVSTVTLNVVRVDSLALGADVLCPAPSKTGAWTRAILTRTPDVMGACEVTDGVAVREALSVSRSVTSLPLAGLSDAALGAIVAGLQAPPASGFPGRPAVTFDGLETDGRARFVGGGVAFNAPALGMLETLAGPDPDRVVFVLAADPPVGPYPAPGDVFVAINPRLMA